MQEKLEASIKSLAAWADKILADSKGSDLRLHFFKDAFNINDFQKFYHELKPYVIQLGSEDREMFGTLATVYEGNEALLSAAMKENFLASVLLSMSFNIPLFGRSADDLIDAIRQVRSNKHDEHRDSYKNF